MISSTSQSSGISFIKELVRCQIYRLSGIAADYVNSVLKHPAIVEWVEAGKLETEVIEADEIF